MTLTKDHYIQLKDGAFDGTSQSDLDNLFKTLTADPRGEHIVLYFHGGLVSTERAMLAAENLTQRYQDLNVYQIFFIWETAISDVIEQEGGLFDFIVKQLTQIAGETIFQRLLSNILQFAQTKINSITGEAVPSTLERLVPVHIQLRDKEKQHFREMLLADQILRQEVQNIMNVGPMRTTYTLMSGSILQQMQLEASKSTVHDLGIGEPLGFIIEKTTEVLAHVITRFAEKTDHGLYPTVVEEILRAYYLSSLGKNVWDQIKKGTVDAFSQPGRGGAAFLQHLRDYCLSDHDPQITLVGHSAGAVYICQLLQEAKDMLPPNVKFNVVFLAPACTYQLFADTLATSKDRIAAIRIFAMTDHLEKADVIVKDVYTRSLLYLVSGIFEDVPDTPILGMQRFFSLDAPFTKWPAVSLVFKYLNSSQHNNVWSLADGGDGLSSHAQHHGAFYSEDITLKSLGYILTNGIL